MSDSWEVDVVDVDLDVWLPAPWSQLFPGEAPELHWWVDQVSPLLWQAADQTPTEAQEQRLREMLLITADPETPSVVETGWALKYLHLPTPHHVPLPVMVAFVGVDDDPVHDEAAMRALAREGDPHLVEPPVIESIVTPLGPGVRSLAYSSVMSGGEAILMARITYAWRLRRPGGEPMDVLLFTSWQPDRIIAAADDIEALARCIVIVEDPS